MRSLAALRWAAPARVGEVASRGECTAGIGMAHEANESLSGSIIESKIYRMAKKTIHYVLSHCHALCASTLLHPPPPTAHSPLVHSRAFAFEIIAAAFCMHSRWQLSGNGWTSASQAPGWPATRWPINFIGPGVGSDPDRYQFELHQLLLCSASCDCYHETETGAAAGAGASRG